MNFGRVLPVTTNMWREIERKRMQEEKETEMGEGGGRELRARRVYMYAEIAYELPAPPIRPVIDTPRYTAGNIQLICGHY